MRKHAYLILLCAVVAIGLLMPPVMAVEMAPGSPQEFLFPGGNEHPAIDGNMIVWEYSLLNGPRDIYCMTTSGSDRRPITNDDASQERPSISGDYVVWQDDRNGNWDIYLYSFSTEETTQLTNDTGKQWLPVIHGNYVVWYDDSGGDTDIVLYDIGAGDVKATIDCNPELGTDTTKFKPAVSDEYVAWEEVDAGIQLYEIATGNRQAVSPSTMDQSWPSLCGDLIAWEDYRWGAAWQSAIYLKNIETGYESQLTELSYEQVSPTLSESIIAWEDKRDGLWSIYMYDLVDGEEEMSVPTTGGEQLYPAVSGNTIVWQKNRNENAKLCVYTYVPGGPVQTVTEIDIEPSTATMEIGEELKFNATCYDQDGNIIPGLKVAWSCNNATVGFIDPGGYFNASAAGTATVTAATAGISATATVTVNAGEPVLDAIEVVPDGITLAIDGTQQFEATAFDESGKQMTGVEFDWTCSNETVGEIDGTGLFTAKAAGTATVTASADGKSGEATVTVTDEELVARSIEIDPPEATLAIGDTVTFEATVRDQFDNPIPGVAVTWTSDNATVGTIDESSGLFTAHAAGTATVTASAGDLSETATVTVNAETPVEPVLDRIEVAPTAVTLAIDGIQQFSATAFDDSGKQMTGVEFDWSCSDETVGEVDDTGLFTAKAAGTATVTASAGDASGTATVTVNADEPVEPEEPVLTRITLTPPGATLDVDDIQRFMVIGYDQNDNVMPAGEITWACNGGPVGTVDGDGCFTALAAGTATVTATAGSCSAEATITVCEEEPALAKIAVVPFEVTLEEGDTLEFSAVAFDRFGDIVEDAGISWECSDSCVGTIDECGVFTALDGGTATITACAEGAEGTATVTVNCGDPVVTCIVITPAAITLARNDTAAFTATALDQDGCEMPDIEIEWECSDETVGEVDDTGFFAALAAGTATVTASAGGVAATADVEVTDDCSGVVVSPSAIILDPGDTRQFTATVYDLQDNAGSIVAWSCSDPGVGEITDNGLFTAVCGGTTTVTATVDGENETATGTATVTVRSTAPELTRIEVSPSDFCIPAGHSLTLTATAFDQYGYEMPDVIIDWESSDPCVGTIDLCSGVFTALEAGAVTLIASADGVSGSACVTVEPSLPVPACIEVKPATATIQTGETREFTATVFDQCENVMDWVRVRWSCSGDDVGTIDRAGLFAAFTEGSADVTACAGGVEGTASVTITASPTADPTPKPTPNPGSKKRASSDGGGYAPPSFFAGICENLKGGETHTFSGISVSSVGSVAITAADNIPKLLMTVKEAKCPNLAEPPCDRTYEYVEIALSWVSPNQIDNATMTFTVPAKWLEEHDMLPQDVRLMRYVDGGWQILETEVVGEENGKYRFRATTPGFSTFAIAAMPENMTVTTTATGEETNATATMTEEPTTEQTTAVPTTPAAPLVYAPLLAPLAFLLWGRRKN
ncbi:Ig-like domain-containing protein [Methanoculleus oceani]|uniref:Intimin n=1 Tax=Methanoculleus oceani TaxID=2184756 RepID=A0ABD4TCY4_9EURY|nr:Ig-like domain-containing protein [Methanoculleus sp. CWC-02]MCM2466563.1 hypothetical protein [Methanoculleus sp. CWC-02]